MRVQIKIQLPPGWEWLSQISAKKRAEVVREALEYFGKERALQVIGIDIGGSAGNEVRAEKSGPNEGENEESLESIPDVDLSTLEDW